MEPECRVRLRIFEGPLDLLLHLINRNKLDIRDIPISIVTTQYLEYLSFLQALNIEVAAEYLVMAAILMNIKSRMLLPRIDVSTDGNGENDDPRLEISAVLEELKKARDYAQALDERPILGRDVFTRPACIIDEERNGKLAPDEKDEGPQGPGFRPSNVTLVDLVDAFRAVLRQGELPKKLEIERASVDLSKRIKEIEAQTSRSSRLSFFSLFSPGMDRRFVIVTFLAILELAKRGVVRLFQQDGDGDIILIRT